MKNGKLTVGSLFAGIGGLELGLEQTGGFRTIWSVEINKFCNDVRRRHWPDVPQFEDIREFGRQSGVEAPDVICGGSPCQDLSCAGKRAGITGERSGLFFELVRVAGEFQPRWVVWENVRGVLSSNGGADFIAVLRAFHGIGYDAEWRCLTARAFGYPHKRERVFLLAYPKGLRPDEAERGQQEKGQPAAPGQELADCAGERSGGIGLPVRPRGQEQAATDIDGAGEQLADGERARLERGAGSEAQPGNEEGATQRNGEDMAKSIRSDETGGQSTGREATGGRTYCKSGGPGGTQGLANAERGAPRQEDHGGARELEHSGGGEGPKLGNPASDNEQRVRKPEAGLPKIPARGRCARIPFAPPGPDDFEAWQAILEDYPWLAPAVESGLCGMVDGLSLVVDASRRPRLRALGNAVVPAEVAWVGERILKAEMK